jgi:uncharacterized lipoprotein YmbA
MAVLNNLSVPLGDSGESRGTLMPKLQYRFRVNFIGMGNGQGNDATHNVISVQRPNMSHDEVVVDTYNSKIYLAGKHSWEPITIELRDDIDSETSKLLDSQVAKQIDMATQSSSRAGASYKFAVTIENLNGGNPTTPDSVLDVWELSGCYIANLTYNESNYSAGGEFQSISVQIKFDNAAHLVGGVDALSGATLSPNAASDSGATS